MIIRDITPEDNEVLGEMIRSVLIEFATPREGTAFADKSLDAMYREYDRPGSHYFVVEDEGRLLGGAGIFPLTGADESICELQKMYFRPEIRGIGIGSQMMDRCLDKAREMGYKKCYLETLPGMQAAQKLYIKAGFTYLTGPMGDTGHHSCSVWMIKEI